MLLFAEAAPATTSSGIPAWLTFPLLALSLLGMVGLFYSIRGLIRAFDPAENAFTVPATQAAFRFALTQPGQYEIGCTRATNWGTRFALPAAVLEVQPLPAGPTQRITASNWSYSQRTDMSGNTTMRFGSFRAAMPGQYELRNLGVQEFKPGDQLRIIPDAGIKTFLFILAIIASAFALLGGGIAGFIAAQGFGH